MMNLTKSFVATAAVLLLGASAMAEMTPPVSNNESAHSAGAGNGSPEGAEAQMAQPSAMAKKKHAHAMKHAKGATPGAHSPGAGNGSPEGAQPQSPGTVPATH
jgi:hypothetical protein